MYVVGEVVSSGAGIAFRCNANGKAHIFDNVEDAWNTAEAMNIRAYAGMERGTDIWEVFALTSLRVKP